MLPPHLPHPHPQALLWERHDAGTSLDLSHHLLATYNEHERSVRFGAGVAADTLNVSLRFGPGGAAGLISATSTGGSAAGLDIGLPAGGLAAAIIGCSRWQAGGIGFAGWVPGSTLGLNVSSGVADLARAAADALVELIDLVNRTAAAQPPDSLASILVNLTAQTSAALTNATAGIVTNATALNVSTPWNAPCERPVEGPCTLLPSRPCTLSTPVHTLRARSPCTHPLVTLRVTPHVTPRVIRACPPARAIVHR